MKLFWFKKSDPHALVTYVIAANSEESAKKLLETQLLQEEKEDRSLCHYSAKFELIASTDVTSTEGVVARALGFDILDVHESFGGKKFLSL